MELGMFGLKNWHKKPCHKEAPGPKIHGPGTTFGLERTAIQLESFRSF